MYYLSHNNIFCLTCWCKSQNLHFQIALAEILHLTLSWVTWHFTRLCFSIFLVFLVLSSSNYSFTLILGIVSFSIAFLFLDLILTLRFLVDQFPTILDLFSGNLELSGTFWNCPNYQRRQFQYNSILLVDSLLFFNRSVRLCGWLKELFRIRRFVWRKLGGTLSTGRGQGWMNWCWLVYKWSGTFSSFGYICLFLVGPKTYTKYIIIHINIAVFAVFLQAQHKNHLLLY